MTSIKKTLSVATVLATISGFAYATSAGEYAKLPGKNWLGYGGDAGQQRYHPSDGINVNNAKNLNVKWIHQHGEKLGSHETTPVIEDGIRDPLWSRGLGDVYKRQTYNINLGRLYI